MPASGSSEGERFIEVVDEIEKDAERTDSSNPFISGQLFLILIYILITSNH